MQLLRDNLTLWTSSDGAEPETTAEAPKETEKPAETKEQSVPAEGGEAEPATTQV